MVNLLASWHLRMFRFFQISCARSSSIKIIKKSELWSLSTFNLVASWLLKIFTLVAWICLILAYMRSRVCVSCRSVYVRAWVVWVCGMDVHDFGVHALACLHVCVCLCVYACVTESICFLAWFWHTCARAFMGACMCVYVWESVCVWVRVCSIDLIDFGIHALTHLRLWILYVWMRVWVWVCCVYCRFEWVCECGCVCV